MLSAAALFASPVTVAYEGFDYLEGGALAGGATGFGWANAWAESGEGGDATSELIIGPGSFPVPPGVAAASGRHVDLNFLTGNRYAVRRLGTALGLQGGTEYVVGFILDVGAGAGGQGVDYAGIELSSTAGGPVVFIGKPPGAGPANDGTIVLDVYGQGQVSTGVPADGQKYLQLRWVENGSGTELLTLTVFNATTGAQLGSAAASTEATFDLVKLVARRDLAFGNAIPAFDEFIATADTQPTSPPHALTIASSPVGGVAIGVSPLDRSSLGGADTAFTRSFDHNATVTLTAPVSVGERLFKRWLRDGAAYSTSRIAGLTLDTDRTFTAVFDLPIDERITGVAREGADVRVTWSSVGGRSYVVQATSNLAAGFIDISSAIFVPGTDRATSSFLEPNAAAFARRFYRLRITAP